jgi:hypothetical protein
MAVIEIERIHERRRAMRVEESGRAYLTERRSGSPVPGMEEVLAPLFGRILNLSETGLLLELEEPIQPGRRVVIGLELNGRRLEFAAVVTRICRPRGGAGRIHVGLRFAALSPAQRDAILRVVDAGKFAPYYN